MNDILWTMLKKMKQLKCQFVKLMKSVTQVKSDKEILKTKLFENLILTNFEFLKKKLFTINQLTKNNWNKITLKFSNKVNI